MPTLRDSVIVDETASDTSLTIAGIVPAGDNRFGLVSVCNWGAATITEVTWGGVSIVANLIKTAVHDASNRKRLSVYYYIAPPASSADVVITFSANVTDKSGVAQAWDGVDQATAYGDLTATADDTGGTSSDPNVLTVAADSGKIIVDFYYSWNAANSGSFAVGGDQTLIEGMVNETGGGTNTACFGSSYATSDGSVDMTWNASNAATSNWCMYALSLNAAAGGSTYNESIAESIAAVDAVSAVATLLGTLAESVAAADTGSNVATRPATIAESIAAGDTPTTLATLAASLAETVSVGDSVSAGAAGYSVSIAEAQTMTDAVSSLATQVAALAETIAVAESVSSSAVRPASVTESQALADTFSTSGAIYAVSVVESQALLDAVSAMLQGQSTLAESFAATDTVSSHATLLSAIAEAIAALDALAAAGVTSVTVTESVVLTDSFTAAGALGNAPLERTIVLGFGNRTVTVMSDGRTIRVTASN